MGQTGAFAADHDAMVSVCNSDLAITAAVALTNGYASTIPAYARNVSLTSAASYTFTLPAAALAGQTLFVSWTLSALGVVMFKQDSTYVWISPSFAVSATGSMSFTFDGATWRAAKPINGLRTAVAPSGGTLSRSVVTLVNNSGVIETAPAAATPTGGKLYVVPCVNATGTPFADNAVVPVIPWGSEDVHTCFVEGTGGAAVAEKIMTVASVGGVAKYATAGLVIGNCLATVAGTDDLDVLVIPCNPYYFTA